MACLALCAPLGAAEAQTVEAHQVVEIALTSQKTYDATFSKVEFDALVTEADGGQLRVHGFWAGGRRWCFRFATGKPGRVLWRTECSDTADRGLHGIEGEFEVAPYGGENPLYRHGPVRVSGNRRRFEHADGTPFFWLADTWWKGLCARIPWEGFQQLAADRKAKGFNVVQIIGGGPFPDEPLLDPRWKNEGGMPYHNDFEGQVAKARIERLYRTASILTFGGGANEIQRDILSAAGLWMPRAAR